MVFISFFVFGCLKASALEIVRETTTTLGWRVSEWNVVMANENGNNGQRVLIKNNIGGKLCFYSFLLFFMLLLFSGKKKQNKTKTRRKPKEERKNEWKTHLLVFNLSAIAGRRTTTRWTENRKIVVAVVSSNKMMGDKQQLLIFSKDISQAFLTFCLLHSFRKKKKKKKSNTESKSIDRPFKCHLIPSDTKVNFQINVWRANQPTKNK